MIPTRITVHYKARAAMFRSLLLLLIFGVVFPVATASESFADTVVRYRLVDWKRKHLHDTAQADKIADVLKKLGCEVEKADHNGHIDIKYRCPQWRQISLETADEATRWQRWFKEYRFQTDVKQ